MRQLRSSRSEYNVTTDQLNQATAEIDKMREDDARRCREKDEVEEENRLLRKCFANARLDVNEEMGYIKTQEQLQEKENLQKFGKLPQESIKASQVLSGPQVDSENDEDISHRESASERSPFSREGGEDEQQHESVNERPEDGEDDVAYFEALFNETQPASLEAGQDHAIVDESVEVDDNRGADDEGLDNSDDEWTGEEDDETTAEDYYDSDVSHTEDQAGFTLKIFHADYDENIRYLNIAPITSTDPTKAAVANRKSLEKLVKKLIKGCGISDMHFEYKAEDTRVMSFVAFLNLQRGAEVDKWIAEAAKMAMAENKNGRFPVMEVYAFSTRWTEKMIEYLYA